MATLLSLALKINSDASGVKLDPVERALGNVGKEVDKVTGLFDKFTASSAAAVAAQEETRAALEALTERLKNQEITAQEFVKTFDEIKEKATESAEAFKEAAEIIAEGVTPLEEHEEALKKLYDLKASGALTDEQFQAAREREIESYEKATKAADGHSKAVEKDKLALNEILGPLGLIPGPFGAIASRLSSLASTASGIDKVLKNPTAALDTLASTFSILTTPVGLATVAIGAFTAAATAVFGGLKNLQGELEQTSNVARKLGVSFDFLETIKQSAKQAGVDFGTVNASLTRLQRTLAGADEESKKAADALKSVGLSFDDIKDKGSEEQIRIIGERLTAIEDPAKRAAAAVAIFGKTGTDILPLFNAGLESGAVTLDRFNARISELDKDRVMAMGNSFSALEASFKGLGQEALTPFIGITQSITDGLSSAIATFGRNLGVVLDVISPITSLIGLLVNRFLQAGSVISNVVGTAFEPLAAVGRVIASVFDAISRALTEFAGRINDAINYVREFFKFNAAAEFMNKLFKDMWDVVERLGTIIITAFSKAGEAIGELVNWFLEFTGLSDAVAAIGSTISSVFGSVAGVFSTIASAVGGVVGRLLTMAESFLGIERPAEAAAEATGDAAEKTATLSKEQAKAIEETNKALGKSQDALNKGIESAGQYGQEGIAAAIRYQDALKDIDDMLKEGEYSAEEHARAVANATKEFDKQMDAVKKNADEKKRLADEAQRQADEITKKVDGLLAKQSKLTEVEQDINAVDAEIARVEAAIVKAREAGDTAAADALTKRLADIDQLRASLVDKADEAAAGFTEGFDKAFAETNKGMTSLIEKADEFGSAGYEASLALQQGIEKAQQQVKDGILTKETYDREVERQTKLFEKRVEDLKAAEKIAEDISKKQADYDEKTHEIELQRAKELANPASRTIKVNDLRSGGTAQLFAAMKEDPAIAEAKKQTKELEKIQKEIGKLQAQRVDILAGAG